MLAIEKNCNASLLNKSSFFSFPKTNVYWTQILTVVLDYNGTCLPITWIENDFPGILPRWPLSDLTCLKGVVVFTGLHWFFSAQLCWAVVNSHTLCLSLSHTHTHTHTHCLSVCLRCFERETLGRCWRGGGAWIGYAGVHTPHHSQGIRRLMSERDYHSFHCYLCRCVCLPERTVLTVPLTRTDPYLLPSVKALLKRRAGKWQPWWITHSFGSSLICVCLSVYVQEWQKWEND